MKIMLYESISTQMVATSSRSAITVRLYCHKLRKKYYSIKPSAFKYGQKVRLTSIFSSSDLLKQEFNTQIVLIMKIVRSPYNPHRRTASSQS